MVSDSMAVAGTNLMDFTLNSRQITRRSGVLTLSDGTLAGADLDLTTALGVLVQEVGVPLEDALQAAITRPAETIGRTHHLIGMPLSDVLSIRADFTAASWAR